MNNANTTANALAVYRRSAQAGEPTAHAWTIAGGAFLVGGIQAFSGVDSANPVDVENGQSTPSGTSHDTPSVTTSSASTMLVTAHTYASANTWTPQTGLSEAFDRPSGANSATGQAITGGYAPQAAAGASGTKRSTAGGNADAGNTHILALRRLNAPPTVSLTSPANGATFAAPASVTLSATAADADGTITKVEFFQGTSLINTDTVSPYSFNWTNLPAGGYTLTAKATDNLGAVTTSSAVSITVTAPAATLYFIHPDHLNTPRVITNPSQQVVWRWDNSEAFGGNMANENPSGLGVFTSNLRFPGQYFDRETNLHYNYYRDYSPEIGRYIQSDPIGLTGGINTYAYVGGNPLSGIDPAGLINLPWPFNKRTEPFPDPRVPDPSPSSKPPGAPKNTPKGPEYCAETMPTYQTCMSCCQAQAQRSTVAAITANACRDQCSHRDPPYPDVPFQTKAPSPNICSLP